MHGQLGRTFLPEAENDLQVLYSTCAGLSLLRCYGGQLLRIKMSFVPTAWRMGRGSLPRDSVQTAGS